MCIQIDIIVIKGYTISMQNGDFSKKSDQSAFSDILLDLSPNIVFFLDSDNKVSKMSEIARTYFNIPSAAGAEGSNIFDLVKNPVLVLLLKKWLEKMNKGIAVDETIPLERHDTDQYEWFHIRAQNVDSKGQLFGKVFYITEVTELYSQKKILDTLMSSIPGEILVFDRNLQILLVSDSVARTNGFHSWRNLAKKSLRDLPKVDVLFIESMIEKSILFDEPTHQVLKYTDSKNNIGWYYVDLRTIKSTAGTFGYIMTKFDITAEIKPKAILEALMDSASDAIAIVSPEGTIEYASQSLVKTLGFDNWHSLVNHPWNYLFRNAEEDILNYSALFSDNLAESKQGTISFGNGGKKTYINYQRDPLNYQNENFGVITIASNTTEIVHAREKAESAVLAKAAFLANMSHELRTPMNAVLGMNELLSRSPLSSIQKNYVSHIRSSATMLLSIINDILDFSRIEDRKMELAALPYDMNSLLQDVINLVTLKVAEKELSFTVDLDPSIPSVLIGDEIRVKQILINLLNNAVKFTNQGEVNLSVSADRNGDEKTVRLIFRIRDTGIGIPKNKQAELFERFARIENKDNGPVEGSGLGLSICRGLVSLMNGIMTLESDEGVGSVFSAEIHQRVSLPFNPLAAFIHTGTVSVLVYETDKAALASIRKMTEKAGVHADFCTQFEDFSSRLAPDRFNYTHVVFEYKTGYESALQAVKTHGTVKWLALLSMTDFIGKGKDPAIDFIFKPLVISSFARFLHGENIDFSVSLPLVNTFGLDPSYFRTTNVCVLVVDDSAVNRKVAEGFLQILDIRVEEAESGEEAIRKAGQTKYDLILMDHMMPGLDGLEAAGRIRKIKGYEAVPIIVLTANSGVSYTDLYRSAGMNDTLYKPIEFNAFVACLKKWLPSEKKKSLSVTPAPEDLRPAVTEPSEEPGEWIEGLDKKSGISFTGTEKNLETILKVFNRTAPKLLEALGTGRRSGIPSQFRVAVHSLISTTANIGGVEISARSRELEEAILAGKTEQIDALYPLVHESFEKIMASVAQHIKDAESQANGGAI